jgi:hypothetical protein
LFGACEDVDEQTWTPKTSFPDGKPETKIKRLSHVVATNIVVLTFHAAAAALLLT